MPLIQITTNISHYTSDALAQSYGGESDPGDPTMWPPCVLCHYPFDANGNCHCGGVDICSCGNCHASITCGSTCYCRYYYNEQFCSDCFSYYDSNFPHNCNPYNGPCYCSPHYISYYCSSGCYVCNSGGGSSGGGGSGGGSSGGGGSGGGSTPEIQTSTRIIANSNVTLATEHVSGVSDNANATQNLADAANGLQAHTSCYGNAPCTLVSLSLSLLNGIEALAQNFTFSISEIAGGSHTGQGHYNGNCIDVNKVKGLPVIQMDSTQVSEFRDAAFATGAIKVYDPYHDTYGGHSNHFHIQW